MMTWEEKHQNCECYFPIPFAGSFFPQLLLLWKHNTMWDIHLSLWDQQSWMYPHPTPCVLSASFLVGWYEEKSPWLCANTAQQWLKHPIVTNVVLVTNPKHSIISASLKNINSISDKMRVSVTWTIPTFVCFTPHWLNWDSFYKHTRV